MNELEKFLESVSGEGESGEFAIDRESAVAKISAHQIPYGGHWALKIIQAAVALGCTAIEVLQTRHKTVFLIAGTEGWDSENGPLESWNSRKTFLRVATPRLSAFSCLERREPE